MFRKETYHSPLTEPRYWSSTEGKLEGISVPLFDILVERLDLPDDRILTSWTAWVSRDGMLHVTYVHEPRSDAPALQKEAS